jgi:DNA (cytosine-5)-methyltransferase 1
MDKEYMGRLLGIDLFSGPGGMSLGAEMAGINVAYAIENDLHASLTYASNHPYTKIINDDISKIDPFEFKSLNNNDLILFGGPPCQGFSTSNQRTRNINNPSNWLFKEFIRFTRALMPNWLVFENVRGFIETENGLFLEHLIKDLSEIWYFCKWDILCASDYGVPQNRSRFFLVGSIKERNFEFPFSSNSKPISILQAIDDLPSLQNGANHKWLPYAKKANNEYAKKLRGDLDGCTGHLVTKNSQIIIERYKYIPQGGNWRNIPKELMKNYKDFSRCHTGIYHRLNENQPAIVFGNYRKSMLIHPRENRGFSVREAARIQSFPDWYDFLGSIGFQQQQVGDAVPPILANAIFKQLVTLETQ